MRTLNPSNLILMGIVCAFMLGGVFVPVKVFSETQNIEQQSAIEVKNFDSYASDYSFISETVSFAGYVLDSSFDFVGNVIFGLADNVGNIFNNFLSKNTQENEKDKVDNLNNTQLGATASSPTFFGYVGGAVKSVFSGIGNFFSSLFSNNDEKVIEITPVSVLPTVSVVEKIAEVPVVSTTTPDVVPFAPQKTEIPVAPTSPVVSEIYKTAVVHSGLTNEEINRTMSVFQKDILSQVTSQVAKATANFVTKDLLTKQSDALSGRSGGGGNVSDNVTSLSSLSTIGTIVSGVWNGSVLDILYGGTGETTATGALNALLPDQAGNNGKILGTDGSGGVNWITNASGAAWGTITGTLTDQADLRVVLNDKFGTTSTDYWKTQNNFYSTTSADHWLTTKTTDDVAEGTNKYFSNVLAQGAISVSGLPLTYSGGVVGINQADGSQAGYLSSADWLVFSNKFATTSTDYWKTQNNFFSTTSVDFWKTVNNFYSTTSADYWKTQNNFFGTTSTDFWKTQNNFHSTTSADHWLTTKTTDNISQGSTNLFSQWTTATGGINYASGNVGVGSTSPYFKLSVGGDSYLGGNLTATGTLTVQGTATSTFAKGIDIAEGCFAINGVCVGGSVGGGTWGSITGTLSDQTDLQLALDNKFATTSTDYWLTTKTIGIANGGTGETTAVGALNALLPSQTGNGGKVLSTDGSGTVSWVTNASGAAWGTINGTLSDQADLQLALNNKFATTSTDYWKTQNNFFSTTSVDFWKTVNNFYSTTSADYWKTQNNFHSTTSADHWLTTKTTDNISQGSTNLFSQWTTATGGINYASGNVGIGTTNPQSLFHIQSTDGGVLARYVSSFALGSGSGAGIVGYANATPTGANDRLGFYLFGSQGGGSQSYNTAGMLGFAETAWTAGSSHPTYLAFETTPSGSTSRSERMRITASGNVGIGTSTPWAQLSINPNGITGPAFAIGSSTATRFIVDNGGNVGIGNSTPTFKLHIIETENQAVARFERSDTTTNISSVQSNVSFVNPDTTAGNFVTFGFNTNSTGGSSMRGAGIGAQFTSRSATGVTADLIFQTKNGTDSIAEVMRIKATGKVGIGTTSPWKTLSVTGDMSLTGGFYDSLASVGTNGQVLQSTGQATKWVSTSTLGFVPYVGANADVNLGAFNLTTTGTGTFGVGRFTTGIKDNAGTPLLSVDTGNRKLYASDGTTVQLQYGTAGAISMGGAEALASESLFFGYDAGNEATNVSRSVFFGYNAGEYASETSYSYFAGFNTGKNANNTTYSNFLGAEAGRQASNVTASNFFGYNAGNGAGSASNSNFFGQYAGYNAGGSSYSNFLGALAGYGALVSTNSNFLGASAGYNALIAYNSNFFGASAGFNATSASSSNFFGESAGSGAANASHSIFIGSYAGSSDTVNNSTGGTSIAIGRYSGTGGYSNSIALGRGVTNSASTQLNIGNVLYATGIYNSDTQSSSALATGRVGIGTSTPWAQLSINPNGITGPAFAIGSSTATRFIVDNGGKVGVGTSSPFSNLSVVGDINATSKYYIDSLPVLSTNGNTNIFLGQSGSTTFSGGTDDLFVGYQAGYSNTSGSLNIFLGTSAGKANTNGGNNTFIGPSAGILNVGGSYNSFVGSNAGNSNISGGYNSFFGSYTGNNNTGSSNNFFGYYAGTGNTSGFSNNFFGNYAGSVNSTGSYNTIIGDSADVSSSGLVNATAIGYNAIVGKSNSISLGATGASAVNVGIGTTSPYATLSVSSTKTATTTFALRPVSGQTANIIDIYDTSGTLNSVLTATGYLGIGTSTPWAQLSVNPNGITGPAFAIGSSTATRFIVDNGGKVGVGTTSPWASLSVVGTTSAQGIFMNNSNIESVANIFAYADSGGNVGEASTAFTAMHSYAFTQASDRNKKKNITEDDLGLNFISKLNPVSFDWKNEKILGRTYGFIAQDVEEVLGTDNTFSIVGHDIDGNNYTLDYTQFIAPIVSSVKTISGDILGISYDTSIQAYKSSRLDNIENKLNELSLEGAMGDIFEPLSITGSGSLVGTTTTKTLTQSFGQAILSYFETLGVKVVAGMAYLKDVFVERLTIGSREKPTGITMFDEVTGEPYCLKIRNGQTQSVSGTCESQNTISENTNLNQTTQTNSSGETNPVVINGVTITPTDNNLASTTTSLSTSTTSGIETTTVSLPDNSGDDSGSITTSTTLTTTPDTAPVTPSESGADQGISETNSVEVIDSATEDSQSQGAVSVSDTNTTIVPPSPSTEPTPDEIIP